LPALAAGKIVVMDRTGDSSVVYQGIARGLGADWIKKLNDFSMQGKKPDLTFLLDIPAEIGLARVESERVNRLEMAGLEFHELVRAGYLSLVDGERWRLIDATAPREEITEAIWKEIQCVLAGGCK
jgi:dTMP kinase